MESNRLIAEFMGLKKYGYKDENYLVLNKHLSPEQIPYHTSWDWLMPVAKKIVREVGLDIEYEDEYREHLIDVIPFAKIEDVYEAVVEFIKNQKR
tara:strand:+ start:30 stop:314 length:285 start_codon:yes stop_codon:yes gene_type:complete